MILVKSKTRQGFKNIFFINFKAQQSPPPSVGLLLILWGLFLFWEFIIMVYYDFSEKKKPAQSLSPVGRKGRSYIMVYMISVKSGHRLKVSPLLVCGVDGVIIWCILISVKSVGEELKVSSVLVYMGIYGVYDLSEKKKPAQSLLCNHFCDM